MSDLVPGLPKPRYGVGDSFWVASITTKTSQLSCPDCLGTRQWKVITLVGAEHTLTCPHCCSDRGYYTSIGADRIPPLAYVEHVAVAQKFTVGGIDIRSHGYDEPGRPDTRVSYYSSPQGGSVYHEHQAYDSEETALTMAQLQAAELNAQAAATPQRLEGIRFSTLQFAEAVLTAAHEIASNAWWAYRFLREDVEGSIENDGVGWRDLKDLCDELHRHLDFDLNHRKQYRAPTQAPLYDALEALLRAFADIDDDHIVWITPELSRERIRKMTETITAARAVMRDFLEIARDSK